MPHGRRRNRTQHNETESRILPSVDPEPPDPEAIAQRAYGRYEARGYEHGQDMDDWLEAERELRARRAPSTD